MTNTDWFVQELLPEEVEQLDSEKADLPSCQGNPDNPNPPDTGVEEATEVEE